MKKTKVKTVLGASILAAALSAQAQSKSKDTSPSIEPKLLKDIEVKDFEVQIGGIKLIKDVLSNDNTQTGAIKDLTKDVQIKNKTDDLKAMLDSSKTEGAEK